MGKAFLRAVCLVFREKFSSESWSNPHILRKSDPARKPFSKTFTQWSRGPRFQSARIAKAILRADRLVFRETFSSDSRSNLPIFSKAIQLENRKQSDSVSESNNALIPRIKNEMVKILIYLWEQSDSYHGVYGTQIPRANLNEFWEQFGLDPENNLVLFPIAILLEFPFKSYSARTAKAILRAVRLLFREKFDSDSRNSLAILPWV